ncbi:Flavonoid 3'-monooxygenase [Handroanthus impetiginosus]|uniref:Flavonoid 3'-monooxygenase n=1 Tax=Handroanthus impetiginosus TaxID=429701 RepID=A0A2G9HYE5_9LAMI|nr:Flavonoid 3'-monooxygenase [Handroanthus impetiginosus]
MIRSDVESLWLFALASKCESLTTLNTIFLAFLFLLSCLILNLLFWAHPGGPAWGKHRWRKPIPTFPPIPGPKGIPIIGSMDLMAGLAHHKIAAAAQASRAKRLMAFSLGQTRAVVTCNPDVAKQILNSSTFADRPVKESAYNLMFNRSIGFAPYGVYWKTLRKIAAAHLFCPKQVKASEQQRLEIANQMVALLASNKRTDTTDIRVRDMLKRASLSNMMCSVFGRKYDVGSTNSETEELRDLVDQGYDLLGEVNWSDHLSFLADFDIQKIRFRCSRIVPRVNRFVGRIIAEHKAGNGGGMSRDFVDVLLSLEGIDRLSDSDMIAVLWVRINKQKFNYVSRSV